MKPVNIGLLGLGTVGGGTARVLAFGAVMAAAGFALRGTVTDPALFVATGVRKLRITGGEPLWMAS